MVTEIWVNIGSGNDLLPDGIKPLPEPMLIHHKYDPVALILPVGIIIRFEDINH